MAGELSPSRPDLIAQLSPERDYGDRDYDQVVREVIDGTLVLEPGYGLPVIRDRKTNRTVKGTGRPANSQGPQHAALSAFRRMAIDDVDDAYRELRAGMKAGDPRFHKIFWENLVGKVGEVRGGDEMAKAMQMLIERMAQPESRTVVIDG
jgi:hypothetical protein